VSLKSATKEDAVNLLKSKMQRYEVTFDTLNPSEGGGASSAAVEALKAQVKDAFSQHS
jgi:hypothetical protein